MEGPLGKPDLILDGIEFHERPDVVYPHRYPAIFHSIELGVLPKKDTIRKLIKTDLFFVVYFINGWAETKTGWGSNHPFTVELCRDLMMAPRTNRLLLAARGHGKSSIDTVAGTIQDICRNPEHTNAIFSVTRELAAGFTEEIKRICENSQLLKEAFPEIFWEDPRKEASKWTVNQLLCRRKSTVKEATVEAWGLVGMPTSRHFHKMRFDDIITMDLVKNPEVMIGVEAMLGMALNGLSHTTEKTEHSVTGTFYHHRDVLNALLKQTNKDGSKKYFVIKRPATHNGKMDGKPVFLSQEELDDKMTAGLQAFRSQQLLDINPEEGRVFKKENLRIIDHRMIPSRIIKVMTIDPAGTEAQINTGDRWAIVTLGFDPIVKEGGDLQFYILDIDSRQMSHPESMRAVRSMFLKNRGIRMIGVEKVGMSSVEIHISQMLKEKLNIKFTIENNRLQTLSPESMDKNIRIESHLSYPIDKSNVFVSSKVREDGLKLLFKEIDEFPLGHADILDALAYGIGLVRKIKTRKIPVPPVSTDDRYQIQKSHSSNDKGYMGV